MVIRFNYSDFRLADSRLGSVREFQRAFDRLEARL
jgi:hypothetical protein